MVASCTRSHAIVFESSTSGYVDRSTSTQILTRAVRDRELLDAGSMVEVEEVNVQRVVQMESRDGGKCKHAVLLWVSSL